MSMVENPQSDNLNKKEEENDDLFMWIETDDDKFIRGHLRILGKALATNAKKDKPESVEVEKIVPKKSA